jgi:hypothetical protein
VRQDQDCEEKGSASHDYGRPRWGTGAVHVVVFDCVDVCATHELKEDSYVVCVIIYGIGEVILSDDNIHHVEFFKSFPVKCVTRFLNGEVSIYSL